ncbi:MAG: hypothetical protein DCC65_01755 [Planctomycetota bacterium]|nr:MAG: hypothetical protein DCC65_01755 [Planctomycetota bacterium]
MTRETKIGLLVGLAFIIVFAIILSEKGPSGRNTSLPAFTVADAAKSGGPAASDQRPLNNAGRLPVDTQLPPIVQPAIGVNPNMPLREEEVAQSTPVGGQDLPPLPESVISLINGTLPPGGEKSAEPAKPVEAPVVAVPESALANAPQKSAEAAKQSPGSAGESAAKTSLASSTRDEPTVLPASAQTQFLTIKTVHEVQSGESLGKIAAQHYGTSTPTRIDAIYEANKETLKDRHMVKAGQKLKIPDLGEASADFESAPDFALTNVKNPPKLVASDPPAPAASKKPAPGEAPLATASKESQVRIPIPISEKPPADASELLASRGDSTAALRSVKPDEKNEPKIPKPDKVKFRVYEVKPKDTLSGIARRELGSERLYSEIYRLNKDILNNKNSLKPGMKLRLPEPSAAAESRTVLSASNVDDMP